MLSSMNEYLSGFDPCQLIPILIHLLLIIGQLGTVSSSTITRPVLLDLYLRMDPSRLSCYGWRCAII